MSTPFSAGPQTLGYLYQAQYALYALLKEDREEAAVAIEGLDDVSLDGSTYIELQQLKHHIKKKATMTDASPELWKTIRVWSTSLKERRWKPADVRLRLITTAKASNGSAAALLREGEGRDTAEALKRLMATANKSDSESLESSFNAFKSLSAFDQKLLVESIIVADESPNIQELAPLIKKALRYGPPVDKVDQVCHLLQGWWFDRVANHLITKSVNMISQIELRLKIEEITSQFQRNSLPIEFAGVQPSESYFLAQKGRTFVRQMESLTISNARIRHAVIDYYRAFEQRTKWAKDSLLIDEELNNYECLLKEAWERYIEELKDEEEYLGRLDEEDICVKFGRNVFLWMNKVKMPIRSNMPPQDEYVARGSYHMLADQDLPPVYWHPNFLQQLEKSLKEVLS